MLDAAKKNPGICRIFGSHNLSAVLFLGRLLMGLFCNESSMFWCSEHKIDSSISVHSAQNPWEIPAMGQNRPAEEGDGTGLGLVSVMITLLIPNNFPSVSVSVTFGDRYWQR